MTEVAAKPVGMTELRFHVPAELVAVLDAKSLSMHISRNRYCIRILREAVVRALEEHMVMVRVLEGNPAVFQTSWKTPEVDVELEEVAMPLLPAPRARGTHPNLAARAA